MSRPEGFLPEDFAPGDRGKLGLAWEGLTLHRVLSPEHPYFAQAYGLLWEAFGPAREMEECSVIERRLRRRGELAPGRGLPRANLRPQAMATVYELAIVLAGERPAAVRDHSVIVLPEGSPFAAVVHLSHNLVLPEWRRRGLAAWMRALPARAARECLSEGGFSHQCPIVLVAEMEPIAADQPERMGRLLAYEAAGFLKVNPAQVVFWQPDFRPRAEILADQVRPLPLHLIVRVCGREQARLLTGQEVNAIVEALYGMYERELPGEEVAVARGKVPTLSPQEEIRLVPPSEGALSPAWVQSLRET